MKKAIYFLMIAALAASCQNEMELQGPAQTDGTCSFTAHMESPMDDQTKGFLSGDTFRWQENDEVAISDGTTLSTFIVTKVSEVDGKAQLELKAGEKPLAGEASYKAYYPASIAPKNGICSFGEMRNNVNGEEAPGYEGKGANYTKALMSQNPMYAESNNNSLMFKNLCAIVRFHLETPEGASRIAIKQINMESRGKAVCGPFSISGNAMVPSAGASEGYNIITAYNNNAKWLEAEHDYYLAIPAQTYGDVEFTVRTNLDLSQNFRLKSGSSLSLERNHIYTLNLLLDDIDRTDLSAGGKTANCYVVQHDNKGTKYKFKATRGCESDYLEGIDHVGIIWKSQATASDLTNKIINDVVTYKNGYVEFQVANNQGNALIGAYDKDGKIIWSWHIWVLNSARLLNDIDLGNGISILDRNLGALYPSAYDAGGYKTSSLSSGFLYQWGRKDPFAGRVNNGNTVATMSGKQKATASAPVTMETATANPTTFYTGNSGHWCSDVAEGWAAGEKTIYDPCPAGYRVMQLSDISKLWAKANLSEYVDNVNASTQIVEGYWLNAKGGKVWFPTTGQLGNADGALISGCLASTSKFDKQTDTYSRIWCSDANHSFIDVLNRVAKDKTFNDRTFTVRSTNTANPYGMAVRCVRGQAVPEVSEPAQTWPEQGCTSDSYKYLANDKIQVGVNLGWGGAVFHISSSADKKNLLNHYDTGRLLQQSFYGDPDGSTWNDQPWCWNPVQGGAWNGVASTVTESEFAPDHIFIKSTPRNWATGAALEDCEMTEYITLEGEFVHIRYGFKYSGAEQSSVKNQEMPALFCVASLNNLAYYNGSSPWKGAAPSIVQPDDRMETNVNQNVTRTEDWAAYVDDTMHGLGIYAPGSMKTTYYRFGASKTSSPTANDCSYCAPLRSFAVGSEGNTEVSYDVYLTIGQLSQIRERFYSLHFNL